MPRLKNILLLLLLQLGVLSSWAQNFEVNTRIITAEDTSGLPGVNVLNLNTGAGTQSDINGRITLVCDRTDSLRFSFIGYGESVLMASDVGSVLVLDGQSEILDEVVVTALGISREEKALGYAVQDVDVSSSATNRDVNVVNTLSGKVSGVQISKTSGGPGASTRVVIRGNSSLSGNNQPLFVVDGIPIDNTTNGSGGTWGGIDYGSPISDINPDDIESMTVLKGPNAAALYGSRAANGVIIITTKKGKAQKGIGVTFNSTTSVEAVNVQKEFQDIYGAGTNGQFEYNADGVPFFNTSLLAKSWGPKMEGQTYIDWDGELRTYSPQPNNYADFFDLGYTTTNSIAFSGGNATNTFRASFSDLRNKGISPNSFFNRNSINLNATSAFTSKITVNAKVAYVYQKAENRLNQSDGRGAGRNYNFQPRNISNESLQDYEDELGNEKVWYTSWAWQSNPYWMVNKNYNEDFRNRILGGIQFNYDLNHWISLQVGSGIDYYNDRRKNILATGSFQNHFGDSFDHWISFSERNHNFLITVDKKLNEDFNIGGSFGGNRMDQFQEQTSSKVAQSSVPNFYHPEYGNEPAEVGYSLHRKRINSLYATTQLSYKNWLFFDVTGRNDWSSTLPVENNSYFYPSFNGSFVFSQALGWEGRKFSFGKIRASWAQVGSDADPYMLSLTYFQNGNFSGLPRVSLTNTLPLTNLKPEITTSVELGTDLKFFQKRVELSSTVYVATTKNQILPADVSSASGFSTAVINAGEIQNKGVEALLTLVPVDQKKFRWSTTFNFTKNQSEVIQLTDGLDNFRLGEQWGVTVEARPGNPYGDIVGVAIAKDASGNKLVNADGTYVRGDLEVLGNFNPDWLLGWKHSFSYKNWQLNFLVDVRKGGQIYSASNMYAHGYSGTVVQTLEGREEWYASEASREAAGVAPGEWTATGGYLAEGVYADGTIINGENVSGQENGTYINPEIYWGQFSEWGNEIHEPHIYDADYVKLRELSLSYSLPRTLLERLRLQSASISLVARNLALLYTAIPNIDPEAAYNNGNGQGIEYGTYPTTRSMGVNLNVKF